MDFLTFALFFPLFKFPDVLAFVVVDHHALSMERVLRELALILIAVYFGNYFFKVEKTFEDFFPLAFLF